jgi:Cu-Zn family superoxide dismutase
MTDGKSYWTLALMVSGLLGEACDRNETAPATGQRPEGAGEPVAAPAFTPSAGEHAAPPATTRAKVDLKAGAGHDIDGEAHLYDTGSAVRIVAELEDAKAGMHGIHIHTKGDCSNIEGDSMGGHFAPAGHEHALPAETSARHLGDLGNIDVAKDGKGRMEITIDGANLKPGDPKSFLGRALVVHSGKDAGKSKQPSGGSGTPVACGVIEKDS